MQLETFFFHGKLKQAGLDNLPKGSTLWTSSYP